MRSAVYRKPVATAVMTINFLKHVETGIDHHGSRTIE